MPSVGDKISKEIRSGGGVGRGDLGEYSPVSGTVIGVNEALPEGPEVVNEHPYGDGWLVKVQMNNPTDLENIMGNKE